jgi:hypothetical protein
MGAAFDDDLITAVAKVISTEARAFNNANRFVLPSDLRASLLISEQDWFGLLDTKH